MDKADLINQLAQEMKLSKETISAEDDQYISATGTLATDPEKSLENLKPVEKQKEDPWSRLVLKPTDFR
ncbi:MAG: hypothetical protein ACERKN_20795 [Velocimicrobium sp.]